MKKLLSAALSCLLLVAAAAHSADVQVVLQSCADDKGRSVVSRSDDSGAKVVETRIEDGKPVLVYNAKLLPHLLPETRTFFYAHECVRNNLGLPVGNELSAEQARRVDCGAVAALKRSKLVTGPNDLAAIEMDTDLAPDAWVSLPGPARKLNLSSCAKMAALALPASASPEKWNRCVHGCGERLRSCGNSALCQQNYAQCSAGCEKLN